MSGVAPALAHALAPAIPELPVRLIAWDGSAAGPDDAPLVELRSPKALQRLLWQPGELGAAQAYVELVGDEIVRVWRLYLVGGSAAFRDGRMGVDQILAVRPGAPHTLPTVRSW